MMDIMTLVIIGGCSVYGIYILVKSVKNINKGNCASRCEGCSYESKCKREKEK